MAQHSPADHFLLQSLTGNQTRKISHSSRGTTLDAVVLPCSWPNRLPIGTESYLLQEWLMGLAPYDMGMAQHSPADHFLLQSLTGNQTRKISHSSQGTTLDAVVLPCSWPNRSPIGTESYLLQEWLMGLAPYDMGMAQHSPADHFLLQSLTGNQTGKISHSSQGTTLDAV